jgi:hypothetical protein
MLPPRLQVMAPLDFDLNQPINWEDEEKIVEDQYDGTVQDLSYGLVRGESDKGVRCCPVYSPLLSC